MLQDEDILVATFAAGLDFNNLSVDQLAAILNKWGLSKGQDLQLGYVLFREDVRLIGIPRNGTYPHRVLWIHNDNAAARWAWREGKKKKVLNHWEGLGRRPTPMLVSSEPTLDTPREDYGDPDEGSGRAPKRQKTVPIKPKPSLKMKGVSLESKQARESKKKSTSDTRKKTMVLKNQLVALAVRVGNAVMIAAEHTRLPDL